MQAVEVLINQNSIRSTFNKMNRDARGFSKQRALGQSAPMAADRQS